MGLYKLAFAVTRAGHKLDAHDYAAESEKTERMLKARKQYGEKHPFLGYAFMGNDPLTRFNMELHRNRMAHAAAKHSKNENAINPFTGWTDKEYEKNKKVLKKLRKKQ